MNQNKDIKLSKSLEDYLESIYVLQENSDVVRVRDLAKEHNVSPSSVSVAMQKLSDLELIDYNRRDYLKLSDRGKKIASKIYSKHNTLYDFLRGVLGVDDKTAYEDACKMEHSLSEKSFLKLSKFLSQRNKKTKKGKLRAL
jgi:DtxR family transcriptional regulator, Mn-dependent transcriptional regulator